MPKLRGALVGFGAVAEKAHLPAFAANPDFELVAVAEENPARRQAAQQALPGAKVYDSIERLLAEEKGLDFVDLATPPFFHARQAQAALERGLHVLCEKPLALSFDDFARVKSAARAAQRCVFTVHNWAHAPQWQAVFEILKDAGAVRHASLFVSRVKPAAGVLPGDWRGDPAMSGGGILVDHGWHALYLLHRLIPAAPKRLSAVLSPADGAEATARVSLEFSAATGELWLSWAAAARSNQALIFCESGQLELRDDELVARRGDRVDVQKFPKKLSEGSAHPDWMAALLPEFAAELADPARRGRNLEEAGFVLQTIQRAYQSARVGRSAARETFQPLKEQARFR